MFNKLVPKDKKNRKEQQTPFPEEREYTPDFVASVCTAAARQFEHPTVLLGKEFLSREILSGENILRTYNLLRSLSPDKFIEHLLSFYRDGMSKVGNQWVYADIVSVLVGLSKHLKPQSYLEVGVRRGRSVCAVASQSPDCFLYLFDRWIEQYAGIENPGPDLVRSEIFKTGHYGKITFVNGNSHKTLKTFFKDNPDISFDLITIDGDHTYAGALEDINDTIPFLKIGGALVLDDIAHPVHPELNELWQNQFEDNSRFSTWKFTDCGYGVAFALRKW